MKSPFYQRSSFWALFLGAGIGVGTLSLAGFHPGVSKAYADSVAGGAIAPETARDLLHAMDASLAHLAQVAEPAVVHIEVGTAGDENGSGGVRGEGSGVIYRPDGYIITNDHVVNGMDKVKVILTDGRSFNGTVTRSDDAGDIAVVKIDAKDLPTIPFADSNKVKPGITAMAVGSPFGLDNTVTIGHVSALDRPQQIGDSRFPGGVRFYADLIQTDAAINMGNSGGALVDIDGNLIGINTAIASSTGGSNGIGFAVPSNQARLIADMLIKDGKVTRAYLGLGPTALKEIQKKELGVEAGAYVDQVQPKTPADIAGLKVGDVITKVQDTPIATYMDLRNAMYQYKPGTTVHIEYVRDHQTRSADVKLEEAPKLKMPAQQSNGSRSNPFGRSPFGQMPFGQSPFGQNPFGQGEDPFGDSSPFGDLPKTTVPRSSTPKRSGAAHLGAMVSPLTPDIQAQFHIPADKTGAVVVSTEQDSVADRLGLKTGDLITSFNGKPVTDGEDLIKILRGLKWGDQAAITFSRWNASGVITSMTQHFTFK